MNKRTAIKSITRAQYYQLMGLRAAAVQQNKILSAMQDAAWEITRETDHRGEADKNGLTCDYLFESRELDELLKILEIQVEGPELPT